MDQFKGIRAPRPMSDAEVTRQVKAWEDSIVPLALSHLSEVDWFLDELEAAREGVAFEYVDEFGTLDVVLV